MNPLKRLFLLAFFAIAGVLPGMSSAREPVVVLNEQFNDVNSLDSWLLINVSNPAGADWFQGNAGVFPAHQGAANAYIAANYLSADNGSGLIDNWLITPELTLFGPSTLSFFARADATAGFSDTLEVRFGTAGTFPILLGILGGGVPLANSWQQFAAEFDYSGSGRFAFRYIGDAAASNYIGIDSLLVTSVPEPSAWLMLFAGTLTLFAYRRQRPSSTSLSLPPSRH